MLKYRDLLQVGNLINRASFGVMALVIAVLINISSLMVYDVTEVEITASWLGFFGIMLIIDAITGYAIMQNSNNLLHKLCRIANKVRPLFYFPVSYCYLAISWRSFDVGYIIMSCICFALAVRGVILIIYEAYVSNQKLKNKGDICVIE